MLFVFQSLLNSFVLLIGKGFCDYRVFTHNWFCVRTNLTGSLIEEVSTTTNSNGLLNFVTYWDTTIGISKAVIIRKMAKISKVLTA